MSDYRLIGGYRGTGAMIGGRGHSLEQWVEVLYRYNWACFWCREPLTDNSASKDHLQPISRGGNDLIENIVPCCRACNSKKGKRTGCEYFRSLSCESQMLVQNPEQVLLPSSLEVFALDERLIDFAMNKTEATASSWAWRHPAKIPPPEMSDEDAKPRGPCPELYCCLDEGHQGPHFIRKQFRQLRKRGRPKKIV